MTTREYAAAQGVQRRTVAVECRATDEFALVGYAAVFNNLSKNLGGFRETIRPGAFARSLQAKADVKCLFNHSADKILGRTKSGTLALKEDSKGLHYRVQLDRQNSQHRDLYAAVQRGDIDECSFAFTVAKGGQIWAEGIDPETGENCDMRTLTDVDLLDVSPVTFPAYDNTALSARSQEPDYRQVKPGYGRAKVVASGNDAEMARQAVEAAARRDADRPAEAVRTLRKAAQACARSLARIESRQGEPDDPYSYRCLAEHMQRAHEMLECAAAFADTCQGIMDAWDEEEDSARMAGDEMALARKMRKEFKETHRVAKAACGFACEQMASARLKNPFRG